MTFSEWCALAVVAINVAQIAWVRWQVRKGERLARAAVTPSGFWSEHTSGWSQPLGPEATGYVMPTEQGAHWWVKRRGRTLIEGTTDSLAEAKREVEVARRDFL